jgi:hypothetical protein
LLPQNPAALPRISKANQEILCHDFFGNYSIHRVLRRFNPVVHGELLANQQLQFNQ